MATTQLVTSTFSDDYPVLQGIQLWKVYGNKKAPVKSSKSIALSSLKKKQYTKGKVLYFLTDGDSQDNSRIEGEYFKEIVQSSDDAIIGKTMEGIIVSWNPAAERIYKYQANEVIGKPITLIFPPHRKKEFDEIMTKIGKGIKIKHFETTRIRKDGKEIDVSVTISPIRNRGKIIGASTIAREITEQKQLEKRKDAFVGMASHELKTPLTSVKMFTQVLQRRFQTSNDTESLRILTKMDETLDSLNELVRSLLDMTKIEQGKLPVVITKFYIKYLVKEIIEDLQPITQHKLVLDWHTRLIISADRDRIRQVLVNLITNAIKYSPQANKVIISSHKKGTYIEISVKDYGIGIPKPDHTKVFERFYQANSHQTYPGLGLGLYISNEIIKASGGKMWVKSTVGKGSTFYFILPIYKKEDIFPEELQRGKNHRSAAFVIESTEE